jgi:DNA-binding NtrC family response regulator
MNKPLLMVVEDDDLQYEVYEDALGKDYELQRSTTGGEALAAIAKRQPNLVILDHILDEGDHGLDYLPELKELIPHVPIILVSGALEVQQQMMALQGPRRAHYVINKPVDLSDLQKTIQTALKECGEAEVLKGFEALERSKRIDAEFLFSRSTDRLSRQTEIKNASLKPRAAQTFQRWRGNSTWPAAPSSGICRN